MKLPMPRPKYAKYWSHELDENGKLKPEVVITTDAMEEMLSSKLKEGYVDNNPKTAIGASKCPLHLVPPVTSHYAALAFEDGARKYGPYNWREKTVSTSVYYGAAKRHLDAFWDGENESKDAHVHHLGHVIACCAIILDAMSIGKLNDDRPAAGAAGRLQEEYNNKKKEVNEQSVSTNHLPAGYSAKPLC